MAVQRGRDVHIWRLSVVWLFGRLVVWGGVWSFGQQYPNYFGEYGYILYFCGKLLPYILVSDFYTYYLRLWDLLDLFFGINGGLAGGYLFDVLNISLGGIVGQLVTAVVGAVIVLWIASFFRK